MAGKAELMLTPEHVTDAHEGFAVWNAEWSPSGKMLASCGSDCAVRLWHLREADLLLELTHVLDGVHSRSARRVSWHPDGNALASASFDGTTAIWSIHVSSLLLRLCNIMLCIQCNALALIPHCSTMSGAASPPSKAMKTK